MPGRSPRPSRRVAGSTCRRCSARTRPTHAYRRTRPRKRSSLFDNLMAILAAGGAHLTDVVRVGIVMRDLQRDRPTFNKVWAERFGEHRPARSAIQSDEFGRKGENARYMIEVDGVPWLTSPPTRAGAVRPGRQLLHALRCGLRRPARGTPSSSGARRRQQPGSPGSAARRRPAAHPRGRCRRR